MKPSSIPSSSEVTSLSNSSGGMGLSPLSALPFDDDKDESHLGSEVLEERIMESHRSEHPSHIRSHSFDGSSEDYPPVFSIFSMIVNIRDEPFLSSFERYYGDLQMEYDPLLKFGAVDGLILNMSDSDTQLLRKIVIRWQIPPPGEQFFGIDRSLSEFIDDFVSMKFTENQVTQLHKQEGRTNLWTVGTNIMSVTGHLSLTLNQICDALALILEPGARRPFRFDPKFQFTCMIEAYNNPDVVLMALRTIQARSGVAQSHVNKYFRALKYTAGVEIEDAGSVTGSSVMSTVADIREQFGLGSSTFELGKMLSRPEYARVVPGASEFSTWALDPSIRSGAYVTPQKIYEPSKYSALSLHNRRQPSTLHPSLLGIYLCGRRPTNRSPLLVY